MTVNESLNINLDGDRAVSFLRERHKRMMKYLTIALFVTFTALVGMLLLFLIHQAFNPPTPVTQNFVADWFKLSVELTQVSWQSLAKFLLVLFAPVIALAWLLHGVQARLLA